MDANDFVRDLNEAQELMRNEKYSDALFILGKLKEADKAGNFDYNLTHKLYQLISNSQSLYNQQRVLSAVKKISLNQKSTSFQKLKEILKEHENLDMKTLLPRAQYSRKIDFTSRAPWGSSPTIGSSTTMTSG